MNKKQTEEYYQELRKMEKGNNMHLWQVINILTNGSVSTNKAKQFIALATSNEFGQYGNIYELLEEPDWKTLSFNQMYLILKYLKEYLKKEGHSIRQHSQTSEKSLPDMVSSFDSKQHYNHAVLQIIENLREKHELVEPSGQDNQEEVYNERWRTIKFKLIKKLLIIFDYMRKARHIQGQTFEKNKEVAQHMDLTMFMRYAKTFDLGATFKSHKIIKAFKSNAVNTIWIDFDRFVSANFTIIGFKEDLNNKQKYLRLRGLFTLISSDKIKEMLNVRQKTVLATIVEGHTGTYKQDIIDYLQDKLQKRKQKEQKRWRPKRLKTEEHHAAISSSRTKPIYEDSLIKSKSVKKLSTRVKSECSPSVYQELKLPSLRIKEAKKQSIYESLKKLDLSSQREKLKQIINIEQNEQYLDSYLKEEAKTKEKVKKRPKKLYELPPMRF